MRPFDEAFEVSCAVRTRPLRWRCCRAGGLREESGSPETRMPMSLPAAPSPRRAAAWPLVLLGAVLLAALPASRTNALMTPDAWNSPSADEQQRIHAVLDTYTRSVSEGDAQRFESQLLDLNIPFAGVRGELAASADLSTIQDYAGFRKAIFESGKRFKQRFSRIKIEQVGELAQVSLDYETALQDEAYDGKGWKVIHLLKVAGQWKIASEFYVSYRSR